jgi:hypothetical protein
MRLISRDEINGKLDGLYNHPADTDDLAFIREYETMVDLLAEGLKSIGSVSVDNDEWGVNVDFAMSKRDTHTRSVVVVATCPRVFSEKLVETLVATLGNLPEKYRIIVDGWFSRTDNFYLFIDDEEICGWFESPEKAAIFES